MGVARHCYAIMPALNRYNMVKHLLPLLHQYKNTRDVDLSNLKHYTPSIYKDSLQVKNEKILSLFEELPEFVWSERFFPTFFDALCSNENIRIGDVKDLTTYLVTIFSNLGISFGRSMYVEFDPFATITLALQKMMEIQFSPQLFHHLKNEDTIAGQRMIAYQSEFKNPNLLKLDADSTKTPSFLFSVITSLKDPDPNYLLYKTYKRHLEFMRESASEKSIILMPYEMLADYSLNEKDHSLPALLPFIDKILITPIFKIEQYRRKWAAVLLNKSNLKRTSIHIADASHHELDFFMSNLNWKDDLLNVEDIIKNKYLIKRVLPAPFLINGLHFYNLLRGYKGYVRQLMRRSNVVTDSILRSCTGKYGYFKPDSSVSRQRVTRTLMQVDFSCILISRNVSILAFAYFEYADKRLWVDINEVMVFTIYRRYQDPNSILKQLNSESFRAQIAFLQKIYRSDYFCIEDFKPCKLAY